MSLKFTVLEDMGGYGLHVDTTQTNIEVGATEAELRRLLTDLYHEFGVEDLPPTEGKVVGTFEVGEGHMVIDEPGRYQLVKLEEGADHDDHRLAGALPLEQPAPPPWADGDGGDAER